MKWTSPRWLAGALGGLVALAWLWLQGPQMALLPGDEPLYLLDAQRLLHGDRLYTDVFLAHPPARVWQAAAILALGAPLAWGKIWAPLATLTTAIALGQVLRRRSSAAEGRRALVLFLLANVVLLNGALFVGVEQALCVATVASALALSGGWLLAGLCLALASQWALHVGILALPMLVWAHRDGGLRRFLSGLALGLLPLLAELLWFGQPMVDQVFGYHLRKVTHMAAQKVPDRLWPFLSWQAPLLVLAALGTWRGPPIARRLGLSGFAALGILLLWPRLQPYYFLLPMPWLAMAAAFGWNESVQPVRWLARAVWLLVALVAVQQVAASRATTFAAQTEMTQLAAQVHTLAAGRPLWGDGALVPLLALRTGLPVALGDTDLNAQRFLSGMTPPADHVPRVLAQKPLIVVVPHHGIDAVPEIHEQLLRDCEVVGHFAAPAANFAGLLLRPR